MIAMTGSILLTVAIALERYTAVHYPISYRQTMKNANAMKKRVATYLIPMTIICILFNVTKFMEMSYQCEDVLKIESINKRIFSSSNASKEAISSPIPSRDNDAYNNNLMQDFEEALNQDSITDNETSCDENTETKRYLIIVNEFRKTPAYGIYFNCFRFTCIGVIPFVLLVYLNAQIYSDLQKRQMNKGKKVSDALDKKNDEKKAIAKTTSSIGKLQKQESRNSECNVPEQEQIELAPLVKKTSNANMSAKKKEDQMRGQDRALAFIMMGYVMVFLICHSPRLLLNIYELATIRNAMVCEKAHLQPWPFWSNILVHISHLMLVINSSINILIYCFMSSQFREEGKIIARKMKQNFSRLKSDENNTNAINYIP